MPTKETREELEKHRLYLSQHIRLLEARNKKLRKKQFFTEKMAERLRDQELILTEKIKQIIKAETPFLQMAILDNQSYGTKSIDLFLN